MRTFAKLFALLLCVFLIKYEAYPQGGAIKLIVSITGNVFDEVSKQAIGVDIELLDETGNRIARAKTNSSDGYYFITGLTPGKKYFIRNIVDITSTKRYFRQKFEINIPQTTSYQEYSKDIVLKPLGQDMEIPLRVSPFSVGKSVIRSGGEVLLKKFLDDLKENPRVKIDLVCFPDSKADENANQTLTEERAKALKAYFVSNGIPEARLGTGANKQPDLKFPPPAERASKGKRYKGSIYFVVKAY